MQEFVKPLLLIGGGGHCKSVIEAIESQGRKILGILDMPEMTGEAIFGYRYIGVDDDIPKYAGKVEFVITVGFIKNPRIRLKIYQRVIKAGGSFAKVIASTARVSKYASIGEGTVILHHALINAGAEIRENCIINSYANIEHDSYIGAQTHISTGVMINGGCHIGERCFIGSNVTIANGINICPDTIVGAGSVVVKNIVTPGIYYGNPAKSHTGGGRCRVVLPIRIAA